MIPDLDRAAAWIDIDLERTLTAVVYPTRVHTYRVSGARIQPDEFDGGDARDDSA